MKALRTLSYLAFLLAVLSCGDPASEVNPTPVPPTPVDPTPPIDPTPKDTTSVAFGADLSWSTAMEDAQHLFYGFSCRDPKECTAVMSELGVNALRLRVLVNPSDGYCATEDVLKKALRGVALGMDIMIAFHYTSAPASSSFQEIPPSWQDEDFEGLLSRVESHTSEVLQALKDKNIKVKWIQIGNETTPGFLLPMGSTERHPDQYVRLFQAGSKVARKTYPEAKIIVHLERGYDQTSVRTHLDLFKKEDFDLIGFSLRPTEAIGDEFRAVQDKARIPLKTPEEAIEYTFSNMNLLFERYHKKSILVEVGLPVAEETLSTKRMHSIVDNAKNCSICEGVFYWEPESYNDAQHHTGPWSANPLAVFLSNGRPTNILEAFEQKNNK